MSDLELSLKKSSHPISLHFEVPFTLQLLTMREMNSLRRKTWCTLHVSDISAIQCILRLESLMTYATYKHFILHNKSLDFILSLPKLSLPEAQPKVKKKSNISYIFWSDYNFLTLQKAEITLPPMYPDILYLCSKVGAIIVAEWNLKMQRETAVLWKKNF